MLADGNYTSIARKKIAYLIQKDNFNALESINSNLLRVSLSFTCGKRCTVDSFGKVLWQTPDDDRLAENVKGIIDGK